LPFAEQSPPPSTPGSWSTACWYLSTLTPGRSATGIWLAGQQPHQDHTGEYAKGNTQGAKQLLERAVKSQLVV
jgi:hypothetical protein